MHLHFLGTRGEIEARTRQHRMHTALLVWHRAGRVMIDCGLDWLRRVRRLRPDAIVLTHAHPDHAWGLKNGAPCPVFAPEQTWQTLQGCRVDDCRVISLRKPERICGVAFEAFAVEHSLLAPAVGYRVSAGRACFFYAPDVVFIHERGAALRGVQLYIGDGATVSHSFIRRRGERLIGHAQVRTQLGWCAKERVSQAIITHCGSEIVTGNERQVAARIAATAHELGVEARIARDGMKVIVR
jgi:phosphoribosyl 1,2-cyclic phosphodiesterase